MTQAVRQEVVVVDVKTPFLSMVTLMVKWAIAAVPAIFILVFIGAFFSAIFGGVFIGLGR